MKDIKGIKGKYYIASLIEEGEHEHQDFKFAISDARKIARSLSAFANNDGGRLLVGVKDNGVIAGVRHEDEDIYMVEQAAEMYCVPSQKLRITAFKTDGGHVVVRVEIDRSPVRPVHVKESDGHLQAYFRVKDENISVPPLVEMAWQREMAGGPGSLIEIDGRGRLLLEMAGREEGVTVERYMLAAHTSRAAAEELVLTLYGMGIVRFEYNGSEFVIKSV